MSRVYISFLGTNDYLPCTYFHDERELQNIRFVQEATLHFFCDEWDNNDRILIFTTDESHQANWLANGHKDRKNGDIKKCNGLKYCIEKAELQAEVQQISIPKGQSEQEIWEIFQIVYDRLKSGDEVIFDITHAFRSIPMLAIVILNYAKTMKNVTLSGIYYGAFEVLGSYYEVKELSLEKRRAPILNLTSFDQLMEWSFAIDRFLSAGDAVNLRKLTEKDLGKILSGAKNQDHSDAVIIKNIGKKLETFTKSISTCRGPEIGKLALYLKDEINKCQDLSLLEVFKPLFNRIKEKMEPFTGNMVSDGVQAAKWCLEHNLIQQGFTILQEILITHFLIIAGEEPRNKKMRELTSQAITISSRKIEDKENDWLKPAFENRLFIKKMLRLIKQNKEAATVIEKLRPFRNDLNHAAFIDIKIDPKSANSFSKKLRNEVADIESFFIKRES